MAILISEQPDGDLHQIGGPSTFVIAVDDETSETLYPRLEADMYVNGVLFHKYKLPSIGRSPLTSSVALFAFAIDVSGALQAFFNNHASRLPSYGSTTRINNCGANVKLDLWAWKNNGSGILERQPVKAETSTFHYAPAMLWPEDGDNLDAFVPYYSGPPGTVLSHVFLTDKPRHSVICRDQSEFLAIYTENANRLVIEGYDSSGAKITSATLTLTTGADNVTVAAVGPKDLDSTTFEYGSNPITSDVAYYEVFPGSGSGSSFSFQSGLARRYYLTNCDCKTQVAFLNKYGFYDTLSVFGQELEKLTTSSTSYQTGFSLLDTTPSSSRRGMNRSRAIGKRGFSIVADNLDEETALWLQQLAISPDVYRMDRGYYESIRVVDGNYTPLDRSRSGLELMSFQFEYSQNIVSHFA